MKIMQNKRFQLTTCLMRKNFLESIEKQIQKLRNILLDMLNCLNYVSSLMRITIEINAVIMDPARAGSDIAFLSSLIKLSPEKVIYVSCNPETLARDLMYLSKNGYKVKKIQPIDMFPHTSHVETVVLMSKERII